MNKIEELKNNVDAIFDELKLFLEDDIDFKIESIEENTCNIKALRKISTLNTKIFGKIIGNMITSNCIIIINMNQKIGKKLIDEIKTINFTIITRHENYYKGKIKIHF